MRTALLSAVLLALTTQPALAFHGGGGGNNSKYGIIRVVNSSDQEVEVAVNSGEFYPVQPNGGFQQFTIYSPNKADPTVSARLPGIPESLTSQIAAVQANKTTVATVSVAGSTVSIAVGKPGQVAKLLREAGVALASGSGLLPLLYLGVLLGRRPAKPGVRANRFGV